MENEKAKINENTDLKKEEEMMTKEEEERLYKKNIMRYLNTRQGGDLKYLLKEFSEIQKAALLKEKDEEENQSLNQIFYRSPKELEKNGVCIRKLDLIETVYESFGKYVSYFQKRSTKDFNSKMGRYKFGNGDTVGLFEYNEKIYPEPLYQGVVMDFNDKRISVAFDNEIEADKLPRNFAIIQLCNQVTYERINEALDTLHEFEIREANHRLLNILFNLSKPTALIGSNTEVYSEFIAESEENRYSFNNNPLKFYNKNLNESQIDAIEFCLQSNELALIHGPPGTGKTTTVVELILQAVNLGKKILVVAPSNIAVDNIAEKLINFKSEIDFELCRIGHPARMLESILSISLDKKVESSPFMKSQKDSKKKFEKLRKELANIKKFEKEKRKDLKAEMKMIREDIKGAWRNSVFEVFNKSKVILATCVGAADIYLRESIRRTNEGVFDMVIIDECAQATEATCWISILLAKKLILAGDHLQLPPTIKSKDEEKVLAFTLFARMMRIYGERVSRLLNIQYRMNEKIMQFSSQALYNSKLIAHDSVKSHLLSDITREENYISKGNNDSLEIGSQPLIYINTSNYRFFESSDIDSASRFNMGEAKICKFFVDYLKNILSLKIQNLNSDESKVNLNLGFIGVITPYSAQVNYLKNLMPAEEYPELEISTVDGFQGREKEIIILDLVRSNKKHEVGFLADRRRLNVAITRAKRMCILICDSSTVQNDEFISKMCSYFSENAMQIDINFNIFDHKEIEDIQLETDLLIQKNEKEKQLLEKEELTLRNIHNKEDSKTSEKKKKKKKNKNKEKEEKLDNKSINNTHEINSHTDNNNHHEQNVIYNNHHGHQHMVKKEVSFEFVKRIHGFIEDFLISDEMETKIEGLDNVERRYIHTYAEIKNLIHESVGEGENRILVLKKKKEKKKHLDLKTDDAKTVKDTEKTKGQGPAVNKNLISNNNNPVSSSNTQTIPILANNPNNINSISTINNSNIPSNSNANKNVLLSTLPPNFSMGQTGNDNKIQKQQSNKNQTSKLEPKGKKQKGANNKKEKEDIWDEIESMLHTYKEKDKNNCNLMGCGSAIEVRECVFCNMNFCNQHIRQPIHDCNYIKNMPNFNADYYKNKLNKKIDNLEKERNKKDKPKKK